MLPLSFHCELMLQSHLSLEARLHRMNLEAKEILFWALALACPKRVCTVLRTSLCCMCPSISYLKQPPGKAGKTQNALKKKCPARAVCAIRST